MGPDGLMGYDETTGRTDDVLAPLNATELSVSVDANAGPDEWDPKDRVRNFNSFHSTGASFVYGDGSVHFIADAIDSMVYQSLSTITGGEVATSD